MIRVLHISMKNAFMKPSILGCTLACLGPETLIRSRERMEK